MVGGGGGAKNQIWRDRSTHQGWVRHKINFLKLYPIELLKSIPQTRNIIQYFTNQDRILEISQKNTDSLLVKIGEGRSHAKILMTDFWGRKKG